MSDPPLEGDPGTEEVTRRARGYLPHWERSRAVYFVTFRLADSLPRKVLEEYEAERQLLLARLKEEGQAASSEEEKRIARLFSARIQRYLDGGAGACHMRQPAIAQMVAGALQHFQGTRYHLFAWCVMPNHVHAVVEPLADHKLATILHSWKSYTANQINKLLGTTGALWEREYYDHLLRDEEGLRRIIEYVVGNPVKANLHEWPWVGVSLPEEQ